MVKAASAQRDITPREACYMGGYGMRTQKSQGVLSPLMCSVLALEVDGTALVLCSLDLLMAPGELVADLKEEIGRKHGVDPLYTTIAAIHTHAAPEMRSARLPAVTDDGFWERYAPQLREAVLSAVDECFAKGLQTAAAFYSKTAVKGFYGNRNGMEKPEDKDVVMVKFTDSRGAVLGGMVNIACHPTVLGADNLRISGDLLGYIAGAAAKQWGVLPVMMQGAAGDMSNRHYRQGHDAAELERTGGGIVAQLFQNQDFMPLALAAPKARRYVYQTEYDVDRDALEALRQKTLKEAEAAEGYDQRKILMSGVIALDMKLKDPHITVDFQAAVLRLGDFEIIKHPGEMFARFGMKIKAASPAKLPLIWGYADDYSGYMPNAEEYGITYESMMSPLPKGAAEEITENLCRLVADL